MNFWRGQRVVCLGGCGARTEIGAPYPQGGEVYLVEAVENFGPGAGLCLYLVGFDLGWNAAAFAPVVEVDKFAPLRPAREAAP
jgi:hypothetical protein